MDEQKPAAAPAVPPPRTERGPAPEAGESTPAYRGPRLVLIGQLAGRLRGGSQGRRRDLYSGYYSVG